MIHGIRSGPPILILTFLCVLVLQLFGCYNRIRIETSRLSVIQDYAGLQFFAIDADAPFRNIWELTDNTFEQDELSTQPVRIPESVAIKFALIDKNAEMASCHNMVLVYVHFSDTVCFSDQVYTRLRYADIAKIEVFEKDAGQVVKKVFYGISMTAGISLVGLMLYLNGQN